MNSLVHLAFIAKFAAIIHTHHDTGLEIPSIGRNVYRNTLYAGVYISHSIECNTTLNKTDFATNTKMLIFAELNYYVGHYII